MFGWRGDPIMRTSLLHRTNRLLIRAAVVVLAGAPAGAIANDVPDPDTAIWKKIRSLLR